mgnify:CR=1 FL=1
MNVPRVDLYNGGFDLIGRLATASAVDRSYAIMEPGQLMFTIKRDDPLAHDTDPRQGRVVVVHSSAYPYPWVGYITNLEWNPAADTIRVTALSLDAILSERALPSDGQADHGRRCRSTAPGDHHSRLRRWIQGRSPSLHGSPLRPSRLRRGPPHAIARSGSRVRGASGECSASRTRGTCR